MVSGKRWRFFDEVEKFRSAVFATAFLMAGCATHPLPEDVTRKTTFDIVERIRCEAQRAILDHGRGFRTAAVAYEFTFDITEENNASAGLSWLYPFSTGTFALTTTLGADRSRNAKRNFKMVGFFSMTCVSRTVYWSIWKKIGCIPSPGKLGFMKSLPPLSNCNRLKSNWKRGIFVRR